MRIAAALLVVLTLSACSGEAGPTSKAPEPAPSPVVEFVESEGCRDSAQPVVETLRLALDSGDLSVMLEKLRAIDEMGSTPTAQCTEALAAPVREAVDALECIQVKALGVGDAPTDCGSVKEAMPELDEAIQAAEAALVAKTDA